MLITLRSIVSGVCTGDQRSEADSYPYLSSSGGWRMDMQTSPEAYTKLENGVLRQCPELVEPKLK